MATKLNLNKIKQTKMCRKSTIGTKTNRQKRTELEAHGSRLMQGQQDTLL